MRPDRIWAWEYGRSSGNPEGVGEWYTSDVGLDGDETEYIRADLVPQWQPIETAPKDGTMILVCIPRIMNLIVRASFSTVYGYWKTDHKTDGGVTSPTFFHDGDLWMPLPNPPEDK